ncbi:MAG: glycosyltransferase family 4 protein, partial [Bdellovibrionota bacterium]
GLEQVAASDAVAVGASGLSVRVLCYQGSPIHENLAHKPEVQVIPIDFRPRNHFDLKLKAELDRQIAQGVNLFHAHQPSLLASISPWLWRRPKVALVVSRHILSSHRKRDLYHRLIYRRVDQMVAMSATLGENIRRTHALRIHQLRVINLGLDFLLFDPERANPAAERAKWGADEDMVVIGLVGRIDPAKGQATFIKAAAGLLKNLRAGERLKFVIVGEETLGSTSGYLDELKKMVAQFHLDAHVVFGGYQGNIPEIMRAFDIFVMPSRQEAFGLVAIEAMAMECPIIISQGGSSREIVGNEEFGLTMKPEDPFDLQRQLRHLLDNPMQRVQMGVRAREHVMRHYDRRRRLAQTLQLYDEMLTRRGC